LEYSYTDAGIRKGICDAFVIIRNKALQGWNLGSILTPLAYPRQGKIITEELGRRGAKESAPEGSSFKNK
jgi:hypothetical protein